jgi:hypothetical protein
LGRSNARYNREKRRAQRVPAEKTSENGLDMDQLHERKTRIRIP